MMLRDVVVGVGQGNSTSVPTARDREIQGIQQLIRIDRSFCRAISHANFAIRSIPVRRTRIELNDSKLGATFSRVNDALRGLDEAVLLSDRVVMMTNGPAATIGEILNVDLARPRNRVELAEDSRYVHCRKQVLDFLYTRHGRIESRAA